MKKIVLVAALIAAIFTAQAFAFVYANHSCEVYDSCPPDGESLRGGSTLINTLIVEGAGHFLTSHADFIRLLNGVEVAELSGNDYPQWQMRLNSALENMVKAGAVYDNLVAAAEETPYNPGVIETLAVFDYKNFVKKSGLNRVIFSRIEGLLRKGDVTGIYILLKSDMDGIVEGLTVLKTAVDAGTFPDISLLLRLNQDYAESLLTGQYFSQVFKAL